MVTHFGIWDAAVAGNLLYSGALGAAKTIETGDPVTFAAGAIILFAVGRLSGADEADGFLRATMAFQGLVFLGVGAFLGRTRPNPVVGVRTPWSRRSRLAWDKSNRLAGRLLSLLGIAGLLAAPIAPQPLALHLLNAALLAVAVVSTFESWRVWRGDPDTS